MDYDYEKIQLKKLIIDKGLTVRKKLVTLSSGRKSHTYFDIKKISLDPLGLDLISTLMLEEVKKFGTVMSVGGLEVGAIPISTGISMKSYQSDHKISSFYVRKQRKEHGLKHKVEGYVREPIVIVDDVITKGDSIQQAITALRQERKKMLGVVTLVDRGGGKELEKNGVKHSSIFHEKDFSRDVNKKLKVLGVKPRPSEI
jgi:orotate phosphoribosyltransferase